MKRSIGVTVIAVLALLGSAFTLLMGILMVAVIFVAPPLKANEFPGSPAFFKGILVGAALMYALPAGWGIATSIGLFRLKNWARISIIVFSVLLILMAGFSGLISLLIPFPPPTPDRAIDPSVMTGIRIFMTVFWSALLAMGTWWLVFFTREKVKQQFVPLQPVLATLSDSMPIPPVIAAATRAPDRPLSLTILAWFMLVGCLFIPLSLALHSPVVLFTEILTGWPAMLYFVVIAAVHLYVGIGLLRLKSGVCSVGIAYYGFLFVNAAVFYVAPGGRLRMLDLMQRTQSMFPWMQPWQAHQPGFPFDVTAFYWIGACGGLIGLLIPLYFLITRKQSFEKAAIAADTALTN